MCTGAEPAAAGAACGAGAVGTGAAASGAAASGAAGALMPAAILPAGEFVSAGSFLSGAGTAATIMEPAASMFAPTFAETAAVGLGNAAGELGKQAGGALVKQGVSAGLDTIMGESSFNSQLAGLLKRANSQTYGASQAAPVGLTGSRGAVDPAATAAASGKAAPSATGGSSAVSGTPTAPSSPGGGGQDGAVKLGVRPRMYGG